jgi:predicted nucleotidyltransferase
MATRSLSHVNSWEVADAVSHVQGATSGLMLYGSHARGDADPTSDIDLLQVVPARPRSYLLGSANVVAYTLGQLRAMTQAGSLFAWHLRTEGVILDDPHGYLATVLEEHPGPATTEALHRVRELAAVLDVARTEFEIHGPRLLRVGRYLLRTAVYARSFAAGENSFSIRRAAAAACAQPLLPLLLRGDVSAEWCSLTWYRDALVEMVGGPLAPNQHGSLEALAVNAWEDDRQLAAIAVQALSGEAAELDYTMLPPPVL